MIASEREVTVRELEAQLTAARDRARAIAETSNLFAATVSDFDATLQTVAHHVASLVGDAAVVTLLSTDRTQLQPMAIHDPDPIRLAAARTVFSAAPYPAETGPAGQVIRSGMGVRASVNLPGPTGEPMGAEYEAYQQQFNIVNYIILPLRVHGQVIGTLGVSRNGPSADPYTEADQNFMQQLADTAALAIANARLFAEAARRLDRLESLHQAEMAAVASLDLRLTLQVFLDQVRTGLGVDAAIVRLSNAQTQQLEIFATAGLRIRPTARDTIDWSGFLSRQGFVAANTVPLVTKGITQGTLEILSQKDLATDPEWVQFAETLAAQAAIAIDNSRLLEQVKRASRTETRLVMNRSGATATLSRSQLAILRLIVQGRSNAKIAAAVHLSQNTVKFHVAEIFHKLGVRNRVEAAMVAVDKGLV
ncbi:MAG: GAF domain-containing protein [Candidatus Dormibacteraeota bacterium]|nr:GAF domain-containing protein [Candidatus Dormibacteraeota bacterium]